MRRQRVGVFVVIKSTVVEWIEVFHQNIFQQFEVEYKHDWLGEDVESTVNIFAFKFSVNFVDFLDEVHSNADFPEISQGKNRHRRWDASDAEVRVLFLDVICQPR